MRECWRLPGGNGPGWRPARPPSCCTIGSGPAGFCCSDLAAQGVPLGEFFRAVAMLQDVDPEFSMDLVDLDDCSASLLARVEAEGLPL
jgi:hypothetical protein